jgi:hypothetical protein
LIRFQLGLPLADASVQNAALPRRAPARLAEHRAIHVSGYDPRGRDFYATPDWVTEALLQHVCLLGLVWELCCGNGAMSGVLAAHRYEVISPTSPPGSAPLAFPAADVMPQRIALRVAHILFLLAVIDRVEFGVQPDGGVVDIGCDFGTLSRHLCGFETA